MTNSSGDRSVRIAALVSAHGRGSNLGALISACARSEIAGCVALVIGTRAEAPALDLARAAGVETMTISPRRFDGDDDAYGAALLRALLSGRIDLICLAGYMRKLPAGVVSQYTNRVMNVHPALLPFFGGQGMFGEHVHRAVLDSGMKVSGCTVHFVDDQYDTGAIIVQRAVPIRPDDTPDTLAARVLPEEHLAYVEAVRLFAEGRLLVENRRVRVLPAPSET